MANRRATDVVESGVEWANLAAAQAHFAAFLAARNVSHLIAVNAANIATLRPKVAWRCAWLLWNQHWIDQPALAPLGNPGVRDLWDAVISVSEFHHAGMAHAFGLESHRHFTLRNAMSPHFEHLFQDFDDFRSQRAARIGRRFIYTSTPFRGLDVLLEAWTLLGPPPDWSCTVVSGMSLYQSADSRFDGLLAQARALPSVRHIEPVGQRTLAKALRRTGFLGLPVHVDRDLMHLRPRSARGRPLSADHESGPAARNAWRLWHAARGRRIGPRATMGRGCPGASRRA